MSNFKFMEECDCFRQSDVYKKIYQNVCIAEKAFFINSDICAFYMRKTAELMCKYIEYVKDLNIKSKYSKKTLGTYLIDENREEFKRAVGEKSYEILQRLTKPVNDKSHESIKGNPSVKLMCLLQDIYSLCVWFYRNCGGEKTLPHDISIDQIPFDNDISIFFDQYDNSVDIEEREKKYKESIQKNRVNYTIKDKGKRRYLINTQTGEKEEIVSLKNYDNLKKEMNEKIHSFRDEIAKLQEEIKKQRKKYEQEANIWNEQRNVLEEEINKNRALLQEAREEYVRIKSEYSQQSDALKLIKEEYVLVKKELENGEKDNQELIAKYQTVKTEYEQVRDVVQTMERKLEKAIIDYNLEKKKYEEKCCEVEELRKILEVEREFHNQKMQEYAFVFKETNEELDRIKNECEIYKEEKEQLQIVATQYEDLKVKYLALQLKMLEQDHQCAVSSSVNQLVSKKDFSDKENLKIFLLQVKDFYDKREQEYQKEIDKTNEERNQVLQNIQELKLQQKKESLRSNLIIVLSASIAMFGILLITMDTQEKMDERFLMLKEEIMKLDSYASSNTEKNSVIMMTQDKLEEIDEEVVQDQAKEKVVEKEQDKWEGEVTVTESNECIETIEEVTQETESNIIEEIEEVVDETIVDSEEEIDSVIEEASTEDISEINLPSDIEQDKNTENLQMPQNFWEISGLKQEVVTEIMKIGRYDPEVIELLHRNEKREDLDYLGEGIVWCFWDEQGKDIIERISATIVSYYEMEYVKFIYGKEDNIYFAIHPKYFLDSLNEKSTEEDFKKVLGNDIDEYFDVESSTFANTEQVKMQVYSLGDASQIAVFRNAQGEICDYIYFYIEDFYSFMQQYDELFLNKG